MNRVGTQKKILDAAELLFSESGYYSTSLREITAKAGVNVAAVNYHFGSKEALLDNVLERRLAPLNKLRLQMLDAVCAEAKDRGRRPSVKALMHAFIAPTIGFRDSDAGSKNFVALVGRAISEPSGTVQRSFFKFMEPFITVMIDSLHEALPDLPAELLLLRFHFSVGTLVHILRANNGAGLPEQRCMAGDRAKHKERKKGYEEPKAITTATLVDEAVNFVTAGMEA